MAYKGKAYVEHVAVRVKDIGWHIRFFHDVLGMTLRQVDGPENAPKQVWTIGGVQLISDPGFEGPEGRLAHIGVMAEDVEGVLEAAKAWGVKEMPQGRNWFTVPDGLAIEVMPAAPGSVAAALAVKPRG